jgi:hypothetical protein
MLKKSLIFGSVALFLTALIALTGCSQATDSETTVTKYENYLYGTVDAPTVQTAINAAARDNRPVVLTDKLKIFDSGDGVVRFGNANVRVEGYVEVSANGGATLVIDASHATLEYVDSGTIAVGPNSYFIFNGSDGLIKSTLGGGTRVQYSTNLTLPPHNDADAVAVDGYTLTTSSSDSSIPIEYKNIFILEKLTVPAASQIPSGRKIYMVGTAEVTGAGTSAFASAATGPVFLPNSVLTATVPDPIQVETGYPLTAAIVRADSDITINAVDGTSDAAVVSIGRVEGAGTLTITGIGTSGVGTAALSSVGIGENAGTVSLKNLTTSATVGVTANDGVLSVDQKLTTFTGSVKSASNQGKIRFTDTVATSTGADFDSLGSGEVIFDDTLTIGAALTITNDVVFNGNVSNGAFALTLGNVFLKAGAEIVSTGVGSLTINKGKSFKLGGRYGISDTEILAVGSAPTDGAFVLTTGAGTKLAARAVSLAEREGDEDINDLASTLILSGLTSGGTAAYTGSLRIVGGSLQIPSGGVHTLGTSALAGTLTLDGGLLKLDGTAKIQYTDANSLVLEGTGAATGTVSVLGSTSPATIAIDAISGSGVLTLGVDSEDTAYLAPRISLGSSSGSKSLTISGVELNLNPTTADSGLQVVGATSANTVILRPGAKIVFSTEADVEDTTGTLDPAYIATLKLTGALKLTAAAADDVGAVGSLIPAGTGNVTITGDASTTVTLRNGVTFTE